jgi:hypothetical protein
MGDWCIVEWVSAATAATVGLSNASKSKANDDAIQTNLYCSIGTKESTMHLNSVLEGKQTGMVRQTMVDCRMIDAIL